MLSQAIMNFQEHKRFNSFEKHLAIFEQAYLQFRAVSDSEMDKHTTGQTVAEAAARLGFYIELEESER